MLRTKIAISALSLSLSTCTQSIKQKLYDRKEPIAESTTASSTAVDPAPTPSSTPLSAAPSASPPASEPVAPPAPVNAGRALVAKLQAQSTEPYQTFVQFVPKDVCSSQVKSRILLFPNVKVQAVEGFELSTHGLKGATIERDDEEETSAAPAAKGESTTVGLIATEQCSDVEPRTLRAGAYVLAAYDNSALIYGGKVMNRMDRAADPLILLCHGGKDGAGRNLSLELRRASAGTSLGDGAMKARLVMKGTGAAESQELPVTVTKKEKIQIYQTGSATSIPRLSLTVGYFNGLTAFATYEIRFNGVPLPRKETNLSFPTCYTP